MNLITAILISTTIVGAAAAQETEPPSDSQIRAWIDQLANATHPRKFKSPFDRISKEERKSLEPVKESFQQLTRNFRASLPMLIGHLSDKRFSYPREHP